MLRSVITTDLSVLSNAVKSPLDFRYSETGMPAEQKKIKAQMRVIKRLYNELKYPVVAGGAPFSHAYGFAAKDLDIYVASQQEAEEVLNVFGVTIDSAVRLGNDPIEGYTGSHIQAVYEVILPIKHTRNAVLANIIIQPSLQPITCRLNRALEVINHFPYLGNEWWYAEVMGELYCMCSKGAEVSPMARFNSVRKASSAYEARFLAKVVCLMGANYAFCSGMVVSNPFITSHWRLRRVLSSGTVAQNKTYLTYPYQAGYVSTGQFIELLSTKGTYREVEEAMAEYEAAYNRQKQASTVSGPLSAMWSAIVNHAAARARPLPQAGLSSRDTLS